MEKGLVELPIDTLNILAAFNGISIDQIIHFNKETPTAVQLEDKSSADQLRLIAQTNDKD